MKQPKFKLHNAAADAVFFVLKNSNSQRLRRARKQLGEMTNSNVSWTAYAMREVLREFIKTELEGRAWQARSKAQRLRYSRPKCKMCGGGHPAGCCAKDGHGG